MKDKRYVRYFGRSFNFRRLWPVREEKYIEKTRGLKLGCMVNCVIADYI